VPGNTVPKRAKKKVIVKQLIKDKIFVPSLKQNLEDQIEKIVHKKILLKIRGLKKQLHQKKIYEKVNTSPLFSRPFYKESKVENKNIAGIQAERFIIINT